MPDNQFDISNISNYTAVPQGSVSSDSIVGKKKNLIKIFEYFDLNHDGDLNSLEMAKVLDYISSLDRENDNDGEISKDEFGEGAEQLTELLGLAKKDKIKAGDIKKFINNLMKLTQEDNTVAISELFFFLEYDEDGDDEFAIQNLTKAEFLEDEEGAYVLTYASGAKITVHADKSREVQTSDSKGNITKSFYSPPVDDEDRQSTGDLVKVEKYYVNGDSEVIDYQIIDNTSVPAQRVITSTGINPAVSTTSYSMGIPTSEVVEKQNQVMTYAILGNDVQLEQVKHYDDDGNLVDVVSYTYNNNGTISLEIYDGNTTRTEIRSMSKAGGKLAAIQDENSIIFETRQILDDNNLVTANLEVIYLGNNKGNARIERVTRTDGKVTVNIYNEAGHLEEASVIFPGSEIPFGVNYDGEGNTYMVMSIMDVVNTGKFEREFGVSFNEIMNFNRGDRTIRRDSSGVPLPGQTIRIPTEVPVDNMLLLNRGNADYERAQGNQLWSEITTVIAQEQDERRDNKIRTIDNCQFSTWQELVLDLYRQEGVENPNAHCVRARINELKVLNNIDTDDINGKRIYVQYNDATEAHLFNMDMNTQRGIAQRARDTEDALARPVLDGLIARINALNNALRAWEDACISAANSCSEGMSKAAIDDMYRKYNVPEKSENYNSTRRELLSYLSQNITPENVISILELNNCGILSMCVHFSKFHRESGGNLIGTEIITELENRVCNSDNYNLDKNIWRHNCDRARRFLQDGNMLEAERVIRALCAQCRATECAVQETPIYISSSDAVLSVIAADVKQATDTFNRFNDNRNWAETFYDFWLNTFNSSKSSNNVRRELQFTQSQINTLESLRGNPQAFERKLREFLGSNFDMNYIRSFTIHLQEYSEVKFEDDLLQAINNETLGEYLANQGVSYDRLTYSKCFQNVFEKISGDVPPREFAESILREMLGDEYETATENRKKECISEFLNNLKDRTREKQNDVLQGRTIQQMGEDLNEYSAGFYIDRKEMRTLVGKYIMNQKSGGAFVNSLIRILLSLAIPVGALNITRYALQLGSVAEIPFWARVVVPELATETSNLAQKFAITGELRQDMLADYGIDLSCDLIFDRVIGINNLVRSSSSGTASTETASAIGSKSVRDYYREIQDERDRRIGLGELLTLSFDDQNMSPEAINDYIAQIVQRCDTPAQVNFVYQELKHQMSENSQLLAQFETRYQDVLLAKYENQHSLPLSVKVNAIAALNQEPETLRADQKQDVMLYLASITNILEYNDYVANLQRKGFDFTANDEYRSILNEKYMEFGMRPPYELTEQDGIIYDIYNRRDYDSVNT